ncbi:PadR family transcriptional regulator [Hazenella sp. IB182353]|uniref:PadR family transcriptional regulator n=1 Tax=Polycladospora coralii TaxID=2771432 RepID=UPI0017468C04|nr:PadR family transcriptional regulator [Polycladospora coralii]MBS7529928.1 PadR family transcriptional regulator [Polycladospora coralii]
MNKEIMKGSIDILILSVIQQGDTYGYEIMQMIRQKSNDLHQMTQGTLYPALKRLENKGYLTSYWGEAPDTGVKRKFYSLTEGGKKALAQKVKEWDQVTNIIKQVRGGYA